MSIELIPRIEGDLARLRDQHEAHCREDVERFSDHAQQMTEMRGDVKAVLTRLDAISGGISKLGWIVITAIVLAVLKLVLIPGGPTP